MSLKVALLGDTMLGRGVARVLADEPPASVVAPEVVEAAREADLAVANLECCISERGAPGPDRASPSSSVRRRRRPALLLGVGCVTLANNHALDYGEEALLDTLATSTPPASPGRRGRTRRLAAVVPGTTASGSRSRRL